MAAPSVAVSTPKQPGVIEWEHMDKTKYYIYGPLSNLATRFVLYPANLIKTRLQVQRRHQHLPDTRIASLSPAGAVSAAAASASASATVNATAASAATAGSARIVAGAGGNSASALASHALRNPVVYKGTADAFVKIIRAEGVTSLYRGFVPNSLNVVTSQVYITTYEVLRTFAARHTSREVSVNLFAGLLSSVVSQIFVVPLDLVSQRLMVQGQGHAGPRHTTISLVSSILREEGLRGFFKGYWASVWTYAPSSAVWWAAYGVIRRFQLNGREHEAVTPMTVLNQAFAGGAAGLVSSVITNPLDVVRARIQVEGRVGDRLTVHSALRQLWVEEGFRGMMNGVTARMIHNGLSGVLLITAYELVKRLSLKDEHVV